MNTPKNVNGLGGQALAQFHEQVTGAIRATKDGNRIFFDKASFPWVSSIESKWSIIRNEYDRIARALDLLPGIEEISKSQHSLSNDKRWKIFPFFAYGYESRHNGDRCPETLKIVRQIPDVRAAMFSVLQPGKEIRPHTGAFCGVLRFHLGVKIPPSQCGISVGGQTVSWKEADGFVFDDTHLHYAWNKSSETRAVLLVDFARPLEERLSAINQRIINAMASNLVDDVDTHWEAWEANYGQAFDQILDHQHDKFRS